MIAIGGHWVIGYHVLILIDVRLNVFDMPGRRVALLVDEAVSPGRHVL